MVCVCVQRFQQIRYFDPEYSTFKYPHQFLSLFLSLSQEEFLCVCWHFSCP